MLVRVIFSSEDHLKQYWFGGGKVVFVFSPQGSVIRFFPEENVNEHRRLVQLKHCRNDKGLT